MNHVSYSACLVEFKSYLKVKLTCISPSYYNFKFRYKMHNLKTPIFNYIQLNQNKFNKMNDVSYRACFSQPKNLRRLRFGLYLHINRDQTLICPFFLLKKSVTAFLLAFIFSPHLKSQSTRLAEYFSILHLITGTGSLNGTL